METRETRTILRSHEFTCPSCVRRIESALDRRDGVSRSKVHFATGRIEIHHEPARVSAHELIDAVEALGYPTIQSPF